MSRWKQIALVSTAGAWCSVVQALGLGSLEVNSYLNEPLNAEIKLISNDTSELEGALVNLASANDFARVGLDRSLFTAQLTFTVGTNGAGDPVIRVTSDRPISDPFLNFLLEVNWSKGRLLREYTILLDPPVYAPSQEAIATAPVTTSSVTEPPRPTPAPVQSEPERAPATATVEQADTTTAEPARPAAQPADTSGASQYGPVGAGDTLWQIAQNNKPSDISTNEMMMALYRLNPEAFFENNINALRRGAVLAMPGRGDLAQSDASLALNEVQTQNQLWESYRQRATSSVPTVAETAPTTAELPGSDSTPESTESRLELVAPNESVSGDSESTVATTTREQIERTELSGQLNRAREDLVVASQQNAELRSRLSEIEDLVEQYERAINVRDAELADLQAQLELSRQEEALAGEDLNNALDTLLTESDGSEAAGVAGLDGEEAEAAAGDAEPATQADSATTSPATSNLPTLPARTQPTLMERLTSLPVLGGIIALLLALGGIIFLRKRGKEPAAEDFPFELNTDPELTFEEAETVAMPEATEADLVAAVRLNPEDVSAHLGLLRYYFTERSAAEFEAQASDLRTALGGDESHPGWAEACEMGADLVPGSPLFGDTPTEEVVADDEPGLELEVTDEHAFDFSDEGELAADAEAAVDDALEDLTVDADEPDVSQAMEFDVVESLDEAAEEEPLDLEDIDLEALIDAEDPVSDTTETAGELDWADDESVTAERPAIRDEMASELEALSGHADADGQDDDDGALDLTAAVDEIEEETADVFETDLDLDELASFDEESTAEADETAHMELPEGLNLDDLASSAADAQAEEAEALSVEAEATASESSSFDDASVADEFDLDEDLFGNEDTVGTKLDLAKAYLDMGDPDGARGMLEEVLTEGNDEQKGEAEGLLAGLE